ncbi:MAG TPA: FAD-dependent oxidoreductase [Gemmatimonas sp.]|nr:FAD-dependent oxidoreductase [Gemmatimonas sp.]
MSDPSSPQSAVLDPQSLLPSHLAERVNARATSAHPSGAPPSGDFILYWARVALRGHENPALDAALTVAEALGLPVFVYHGLSSRYPFASDRHHTFILEGARDFAAELGSLGIGSAFHLERPGDPPYLVGLAERAALVVTERMPVAPLAGWTAALAHRVSTPLWELDTACVVPVTLTTKAYDRAFAYRDATKALRAERLTRPWPEVRTHGVPFIPTLPFTPVDFSREDIASLVASCDIDHGVGPVSDTRGGSVAGYARWRAFTKVAIARYDATRNDPVRGHGVSRMSAYLHYGMVSPFRLAREAAALPGTGPAKWLDELLVWREVAYTFCHHRADHATEAALPEWARATLREHERDRRVVLDWERLARGRTPDDFWNAMQRSLLAHGELHNNVRMTWGKAVPGWTANAADALAMLIDLNHRYALDGRDPASYGGLLWCLGQFDRAFTPPNRVLGTVRGRDSSMQAERIDVPAYVRHVNRAAYGTGRRVAVIGAGLAGLTCARTLSDHNIDVTVFEKSRGPGGRCATRREGPWQFDHGAQYFTSRDARLAPLLRAWEEQGIVARWEGRLAVREDGGWRPAGSDVARWVGVPGMSAVGKHLASDLRVVTGTTVASVQRSGDRWSLLSADGNALGEFDNVLVAIPAPQARALMAPVAPQVAADVERATMHPVWSCMLVFENTTGAPWDGAFVNDSDVLSWVARDSSKPGRGVADTWVLHATRAWTEANLEADAAIVERRMSAEFRAILESAGAAPAAMPVHAVVHRWRFALADPVVADSALYDATLGIGAGGDWCGGPRVEGAMLSGIALAGRVMSHTHAAEPHR